MSDGKSSAPLFLPRIKGAFTMMITVTMIIYHVLLAGGKFPLYTGGDFMFWLSLILLHYISPLMVILDWLLLSPKRAFRLYDPLIWTAIPFAYVIAMLIRAEIGGIITGIGSRFPYFFLDIDLIGWMVMSGYVAVITFGFILVGYAMVLIDRLTAKPR
jgi:hypothetical protein